MRVLKIAGLVLLSVALALGAAALWKREEIARLMAVNSLFAPDRIVTNFSHMDRLFLHVEVPRGDGPVSPLPPGAPLDLSPEVKAWMDRRSVTGMIVLKDGAVRAETYRLGTGEGDLRISWSVAKSFLAALYGILLAEGAVPPLDTPVAEVVPALRGSAYDGATVRDVMVMASGVAFDEDYLDFNSDINRMGRVLALGGSMDGFAAGLTGRAAEPGTRWHYVSIDTHVIGMVIRSATGRTIPDLLAERLIAPMGFETAPLYLTDGEGTAFVLGGLNVTLRDYARFGAMLAAGGRWQGVQVVPADWIDAATRPQAPGGAAYGYQFWLPADARPGEFFARGIYGQYIYVDRASGAVIAVTSADRNFDEPGVEAEDIALFRSIVAAP